MVKVGVGQQTEKAVDNAMESMAKNIKFKRVVDFSITVLGEVCAQSGILSPKGKGYKQCISVLQNHASSPEFCKKTCIILKQLLQNVDDPQLPYRMVESGCAEALQLIIETPPEKDDETKQYVLEILNSLFAVKGVLHKVVAKHGKGVLKMFMNTEQTKLAKNVIDCMRNTASEGLEELDNESLTKMNQLVMKHQQDLGVNISGSLYIKNLFENSKNERIQNCGITVRDIVRSFGPHNMDEQVFRNLDVAIDKIGSEKEFYEVVDTITKNPNSDDFWIMSHLLDLPSVEIEKKRNELNSILASADSNNLVKSLNSEVCFFLKELHRARPEMAKDLMKDKQSLIKKIMDEIDHIKGPHKFLGLQVLEQNIETHGKYMRENDIIKKAEKWVKECENPEDMVRILDFLSAFSGNSDFKQEMFSAGLDKLVIERSQTHFENNPKVFQALYKLMDNCVRDDADIQKFCESGNANRILAMGGSLVDEIEDLGGFINFTNRLLNTKDADQRFKGAFNDITRLYCTRFERRIVEWFEKWFEDRTKKEVWVSSYNPKFLSCISTADERQALRHVMASYDLATIESIIHKAALGEKGMDFLTTLSQYIAIFVCLIAKDEPDTLQQLTYRVAIDDAIQTLKNNLEFITEKAIKNRIISRYLAMFCALLPLFHQKAYLKRVTSKRLEFCCNEFINFIEYSVPKQPLIPFYLMSAYGLYDIPEAIKPELPKVVNAEGEEDKGAAVFHAAVWTPLTFILNDASASSPITEYFIKLGKRKPDPLTSFAGYLALRETYNFGTLDTDLLLDSQLLANLISQIDEETMDFETATSAIHCMDKWCEHSDKATLKLNSMGAYEKLVRFMNNLRNQDILKMVISSLLQKLANINDGQQLEYDLERIVKKCKDYDDQCATKGDDLREDALGAYNELSGLIQMEKAQQYCNNKGLQSTTLNTLATELKRNPNDLLAKGVIVNYQDMVLKLFETNTHLFRSVKAKPEELALMTNIFKRTLDNWSNDTNTLRGLLELTLNVVRRKGQLEFSPEASRKIHQQLNDLADYQRNNPDIVEKIALVQQLLDTEGPKEPEVVAVPQAVEQNHSQGTPEQQAQPDAIPEPDRQEPEPIPEPAHDPEPEPTPEAAPAVEEPVTEEQIQEMHAPPAAEEIEEEERNKQDMKESFVTEAIFATAQEQAEEAQPAVKEEDAPIVFAEPEHNQAVEEEPIIQEPPSLEWDLRVEADRQKAMGMLSTKEANLEDTSQDGYIYQIVLKAEELVTDELALAIFYAKWVTKISSIQPIEYYLADPFNKLKENIEKFEGHPDLLKVTCAAAAARTKDNPTQVANYTATDILIPLRTYCATSTDPATLVSFAKTIINTIDDEQHKIAASQKGVIRVFTNGIFKTLKDENETVHRSMFKAVKMLCSSKTSCPMNIEKTDFLEKLIDFAAECIPKPQLVVLVLEVLGVIFKYGGEKIRNLGIEFGVTNFYTEVFLTYKDDPEVMKYFYASAGNIGDNQTFWKTLDSVELSGFIFGNLTTYPLDVTRSALVCLVFLTKIDDTCEKSVQSGLYRWLDPCIRSHNDTMVLSYVFVIENAITATMRRQNKLNEERFYDVVMQYHPEVVATKNEKLLILWLSVLCKLTNSKDSCQSLLSYLYPTLDGLLREHYYNEPVFEKLYNLMSNILLGSHVPANEINALLHLSFHKLSVGTQTENFFMLYVNFLEKLSGMVDNAEIRALMDDLAEQIVGSMHSVPLLLRHISEQIQARFKLVFPRPVPPLAVTQWLKSSLDAKTLHMCHLGTPCKRYRPQAVIETGMLFLDRQIKHLVFQKTNSLSIMSRDVMFLGDIIKIVKGHDERSYFAEAIQKHNLSIPQDVCIMVLSSKISYGETGFHIQFPDQDGRTLWKNAIRSFIDDVEAKK